MTQTSEQVLWSAQGVMYPIAVMASGSRAYLPTKFVTGCAVAIAAAGRLLLRIRLRFYNHATQQVAIRLAFHQNAANQFRRHQLGGAGEEGSGVGWEVVGSRGGYLSGLRGGGWRRLGGEGLCGNGITRNQHKACI
jgi:hypothetical protein